MRPARRVSALCAAFDGGGRPRPAVPAAGPMRMATLALAVDQTAAAAAAGAAAARAGELPPRTAGRGQGRPAAGVRSSPAAGAARLDATPGVVDAPASPRPASSTPLQCAVPASLPSAAHPRKSHRRSDQGADWPAHSARTVHATVRSSGTHPRPPCPPNPPPARPYPAHVDSKKRRSEQRRRLRRAAPAQQAGANRIIAVAVARATSTCRPRTSARPSERETVPLDARRRVASLGATAERVGLGVNSYRDARRPTTGSSRRSALGTSFTRPATRPSSTTKPAHRDQFVLGTFTIYFLGGLSSVNP